MSNIFFKIGLSFFIVSSLFFLGVKSIYSQNINDQRFISLNEQDITLRSSPEFPKSNQDVVMTLTSYAVNLDRLRITWIQNGQVKQSGIGETTFNFKTGTVEEQSVIDIYIQVTADNIIRKQAVFNYRELDLLWEAVDSYVPPFSKLRRLPARESILKLVSIPDAANISISDLEKNLVYRWSRNGKIMREYSGFGKNTILIRNDILEESEIIDVSATNQEGFEQGKQSLKIDFLKPELYLFVLKNGKKIPVNNFYTHRKSDGLLTVIAEPYFYSVKPFTINFLNFTWNVNGNIFEDVGDNFNILPLDLDTGTYTLKLDVENPQKIMQLSTQKDLIIDVVP